MTHPVTSEEELRIALVMNGGVSLSVWIGGVTHELNRLLNGDGTVYAGLQGLTRTRVRVDVISGTSAGGINGALLAHAVVFGADTAGLRDLWVERGAFARLLRNPFQSDPPSLLDGDGYFLPELEKAFDSLGRRGRPHPLPPAQVPVDLSLTTTLLHAESRTFIDDLGTRIEDARHRGRFHFQRSHDTSDDQDPFANRERIGRLLARASRATASFPVAFEPSFCSKAGDFEPYADFQSDRYLLDGGILDNKPLEAALAAVFAQRHAGDVRRVLAYVAPDPGHSARKDADRADQPPTLREVALASLIGIPGYESIAQQLEQIREHNHRVQLKRNLRIDLIRELGAARATSGDTELAELARQLFPIYRQRRVSGAVDYILEGVRQGLDRVGSITRGLGRNRRAWLAEQLRRTNMPRWVPARWPETDDAPDIRADTWRWGLYTVEYLIEILFDVLGRGQRLVRADDHRTALSDAWQPAYDVLDRVGKLRRHSNHKWQDAGEQALQTLDSRRSETEWAERLFGDLHDRILAPGSGAEVEYGQQAYQVADILRKVARTLRQVAERAESAHRTDTRDAARDLRACVDYLSPGPRPSVKTVLRRMLALEVVHYATHERDRFPDQRVELVQISANVRSPWGGPAAADGKLAGMQLAHFGAFYKKSWRANDWMFGRLDGSERLLQVVLHPARLYRLYGPDVAPGGAGRVLDRLRHVACEAPDDHPLQKLLSRHWEADLPRIAEELAFLDGENPDAPLPDALPCCTAALVRRVHLEDIFREELPNIAHAAEDDLRAKASPSGPATEFVARVRRELGANHSGFARKKIPPGRWVEWFQSCRIGEEDFAGEAGSDQFTESVTQAIAVGAGALGAENSGLGWFVALSKAVRAPLLLAYLLARSMRSASRTGLVINSTLLAVGATLLALPWIGVEGVPDGLELTGATLLAAGLLIPLLGHCRSALRWFRGRRPARILLALAVTAGVGGLLGQEAIREALHRGLTQIWPLLALVAGLLVVRFAGELRHRWSGRRSGGA